MDDEEFKKWQRDIMELHATQALEVQEHIAKYRHELDDLEKEKREKIDYIGNSKYEIDIVYAKKAREIIEKRDREIDEIKARQLYEEEVFLGHHDEEEQKDPQQTEQDVAGLDWDEAAVTNQQQEGEHHQEKEPDTPIAERNPEQYRDLIEKLKAEREWEFSSYFKELIDLFDARSRGLSDEIYQDEKEKLRYSIQLLGVNHYTQLIDHIENPALHKELKEWEDQERARLAEVDKERQLKQAEQEREKEEKRLLEKQAREDRIKLFDKMAQEYTERREKEIDHDR